MVVPEVAYKEILRSWEKGDYSDAVSQHNKVWSLQYGQIGEALTILSSEEEVAYINTTLTRSLTYSGNSIEGWSKKTESGDKLMLPLIIAKIQ
ncbi:DUF6241 domain-containing protein [Bacillus anthracis]|uniref:DUF6241 domain-containing protein n=1 Tax=Bacillus anthracis TaxID=1392 RepID=UPI003BA1FB6F